MVAAAERKAAVDIAVQVAVYVGVAVASAGVVGAAGAARAALRHADSDGRQLPREQPDHRRRSTTL